MGQVEVIWGAFSLMILGALISMCMKCQQTVQITGVNRRRQMWTTRELS
ncbi:hypothetical protein E2320_018601, partial [Naja naja]